ncbi:MAG TPA: segregation/condensation protein A [Abditibacteriaceae bacterium]|nr:segregation/condensation protein A [Abditibacteriaceae bacterium]
MTTSPLPLEEAPPSSAQPFVREPERFTGHRVHLQIFEGPLDLLLYLIRAHRYDICDIPVREVTAQFLDFLRLMNEVDLDYAGDFLVTAATLMQIKSRMLLPKQESANEEVLEEDSADPRQELVERLLEYQKFQEAADGLKELREERSQVFPRTVPLDASVRLAGGDEQPAADTLMLQDVSTFDLLRALQRVLERILPEPMTVRREPFTVGERVRGLLRRLHATAEPLTFGVLCDDCESRLEVVVTFLALLELIRRGQVAMSQRALFDEIWIRISQ